MLCRGMLVLGYFIIVFKNFKNTKSNLSLLNSLTYLVFHCLLLSLLIFVKGGYIETNPRPNQKSLKVCHS